MRELACSTCGRILPEEAFTLSNRRSRGRVYDCKECCSTRIRAYRRDNQVAQRATDWRKHLKSKYGITPERFEEIREAQDGRCAICGKCPEDRLCVDHDHSTGRIRGLLCRLCNKGLGCLGDTVESIETALNYLRG